MFVCTQHTENIKLFLMTDAIFNIPDSLSIIKLTLHF